MTDFGQSVAIVSDQKLYPNSTHIAQTAPPIVNLADIFDELTPREREILELIAQEQTNSEIAPLLNLSPKTVSSYIPNVLLKVQATDRAKIVLLALEAAMSHNSSN